MRLKKFIASLVATSMVIPSMAMTVFADVEADEQIVAIDETTFPDEGWRNVVKGFDTDGVEGLSQAELDKVTTIVANDGSIGSLDGIGNFRKLQVLLVSGGTYTSLDLSDNYDLQVLEAFDSSLESIEFGDTYKLWRADLHASKLKNIDISNMENLVYLNVDAVPLMELDISHNPFLKQAFIAGLKTSTDKEGYMYSLMVDGGTYTLECTSVVDVIVNHEELIAEGVAINDVNFPDLGFRNYVKKFDVDNNTYLSEDECNLVSSINCQNLEITNLIGINNFHKLIQLNASGNLISGVDLSENPMLSVLELDNNFIVNLDLSSNPELYFLSAKANQIEFIQFPENHSLSQVYLQNNPLKKIDVSGATSLQQFFVGNCTLDTIDLSQNEYICILSAVNAGLNSLDISGNIYLRTLDIFGNNISELNLLNNAELYHVNLIGNPLSLVNIKNCPKLIACVVEGELIEATDDGLHYKVYDDLRDYTFEVDSSLLVVKGDGEGPTDGPTDMPTVEPTDEPTYVPTGLPTEEPTPTEEPIGFIYKLEYDQETGDIVRLTINGEGEFPEVDFSDLDLSHLEVIDVIGDIPSIPDGFISGYPELKFVFLSDTITDIGANNFNDLPSLSVLTLPRSLENYDFSFEGTPLKELVVYCDCPVKEVLESAYPEIITIAHDVVIDEPYDATYDHPGLTEGRHCTACGLVLVEQQEIPQLVKETEPGVAGFAERLYSCALGRESDPKGKQDWIDALEAGTFNGAEAAHAFLFSEEVQNADISDEEFVTRLYATFMDREPDADGFETWMNVLNQDWTREQVFMGFVDSQEWANVCFKFDILSGGAATPDIVLEPSEAVIAFATRLYTTCLGRDGDAEGIKNWSDFLANRKMTGAEAALNFFFSAEFQAQNVDNETYVNRLYVTFMGRPADQGGFEFWVGLLESGEWNRLMVLDGFAKSDEFKLICKEAGIRP